MHVPFAVAPSAVEQTWHDPEQAESQHTPSTQFPVEHSRQLRWRQSTPAVALQVEPWAFCAWHVPFAAQ